MFSSSFLWCSIHHVIFKKGLIVVNQNVTLFAFNLRNLNLNMGDRNTFPLLWQIFPILKWRCHNQYTNKTINNQYSSVLFGAFLIMGIKLFCSWVKRRVKSELNLPVSHVAKARIQISLYSLNSSIYLDHKLSKFHLDPFKFHLLISS